MMQRRPWAGWLALSLCNVLAATAVSAQATVWPEGWLNLPPGGTVFHLDDDPAGDGTLLHAHTDNDAGSLLVNVAYSLTERTTLQWNWRVEDLPSERAEDTAQTHDYLAIAVMFDNGQVLSYIWSSVLPVGAVFACPLPRWKDLETHLVLYSGSTRLGEWLSEEKSLLADYERFKEGPLPSAIQQIWFIAGSRLQGGNGAASFGSVSVGDGKSSRLELFAQRGINPFDRKLSAMHASLPGHWLGHAEVLNRQSGARSQQELALTYTTTSQDRLNYASWNERGLTLAEYYGDGRYTLTQWPLAGAPLRIEYRVVDVNEPDGAGNWSVDELVSYPAGNGGTVQWSQVWSLKDGELSVTRGAPPSQLPLSQPWFQ
jgi:hypothetical protein